ncbi:hypothetical protein THASP1DRAFT_31994 [Thamnocephalis sphaerospora]|uniref:Coilin tudor domain-containing protein n=1 Tax=Thamnocephalis sphaerospora TaxID=78915 RepID=A0A4P9XK65_9FUNG|nr:hypothetical protein THASP1DRAFT_31994 [Thamnocephalis sphaerospora]|eukprot:RKP06187.1 hypothetical protein THASP1DRAFT_31994 [Thamnocephalis sphaerospora]
MRIRLESVAPLVPLRCWYEVPAQNDLTIHQLLQQIAQDFGLATSGKSTLALELDGFRLLPSGRAGGLLRENDLLRVISLVRDEASSKTTTVAGKTAKRSRSVYARACAEDTSDSSLRASKRRTHTAASKRLHAKAEKPTLPDTDASSAQEASQTDSTSESSSESSAESSAESSTSSSESSSESSSSESENDSDSDDSSASDSDSSSAPSEVAIANDTSKAEAAKSMAKQDAVTDSTLTPPGKGTSATHRRNMRRKLARQRAHEASSTLKEGQCAPAKERATDDATENALHVRVQKTAVQAISPHVLAASNKNKSKAFAKKMSGAVRTHVHFDQTLNDEASPSQNSNLNEEHAVQASGDILQSPPRLVVTAVEFHGVRPSASWHQYRTEPIPMSPTPEAKPDGDEIRSPQKRRGKAKKQRNTDADAQPEITVANQATAAKDVATADMSAGKSTDKVEVANVMRKRDYASYESLTSLPQEGQVIAFKMLEMSADYSPEISDYKEATVLAYNPVMDQVTLRLAACPAPVQLDPDEEVCPRRFEMQLDDDEYVIEGQHPQEVIRVERNSLFDLKLVA